MTLQHPESTISYIFEILTHRGISTNSIKGRNMGGGGIFFQLIIVTSYTEWVACQEGMAHPQVADRHGLQIQKVDVNIHKQSWTIDVGCSSRLGVGWG
jgi:hypothetical protein